MAKYLKKVSEARAYVCPVCGAYAQDGDRSCRHCSSLLATLRCSACFELSLPDALHCSGCGHELGLMPASEPSELSCPDCKVRLHAFSAGSGPLYGCERCGGQLVSHELLRALLEAREAIGCAATSVVDLPRANPLRDPVRYRPCPECGEMMNRRNFAGTSGVVIDVCARHGSFFEAGELPRVLAFARRGGLVRGARVVAKQTERATLSPDWHRPHHAPSAGVTSVTDLLDFLVELLTRK